MPSIVAVTETWLSADVENSILPMSGEYTIFRKDRNGIGGGVALFVRNDIPSHPINTPCGDDFEAVFVKLTTKGSTVIVAVCYKPSVGDVHLLPEFEKMLCYLDSLNECYVVLGDFNLPDVRWDIPSAPKTHKQENFMCAFLEHGLSQCVAEPTRGDAILDLIFENTPSTVMNVVVSNSVDKSDHNTVWFDLNLQADPQPHIEKFAWHKADHTGITVALEMTNWSNVLGDNADCDTMWKHFVEYCDMLFDDFVPKVRKSTTFSKRKRVLNLIKKTS
jgi:hypothetical protein